MTLIKVKTTELIGPALDWAVAKVEGFIDDPESWLYGAGLGRIMAGTFRPSTDWSQGGPLIDKMGGFELKVWLESKPETKCEAHIHNYDGNWIVFGPTPLVAAMRCLVAAKLGDTVQVPKELR